MDAEPKVIKRDGEIGFRRMSVEFDNGDQTVTINNYSFSQVPMVFNITDFLNLVEQAVWYYDEFASKEEK